MGDGESAAQPNGTADTPKGHMRTSDLSVTYVNLGELAQQTLTCRHGMAAMRVLGISAGLPYRNRHRYVEDENWLELDGHSDVYNRVLRLMKVIMFILISCSLGACVSIH